MLMMMYLNEGITTMSVQSNFYNV